MEITALTTIIIFIYTLSAMISWNWIRIAHSSGGVYEGLTPGGFDLFMVYCPIINTVFTLGWIFKYPKETNKKYSNHFNIKK